jgi:hypothetical protein
VKRDSTDAHYVNNKEFFTAIVAYREEFLVSKMVNENDDTIPLIQIPEYIGSCIMKIATHLAYKSNFIGYTYRDDMILDAIENCIASVDNFDPEKSANPFAYFTQVSYYAFLRRIQKEKKNERTKNKYIESLDLSDIITQKGDNSTYANSVIQYLKGQVDQANKNLAEQAEVPKQLVTRKPRYMSRKAVVATATGHRLEF